MEFMDGMDCGMSFLLPSWTRTSCELPIIAVITIGSDRHSFGYEEKARGPHDANEHYRMWNQQNESAIPGNVLAKLFFGYFKRDGTRHIYLIVKRFRIGKGLEDDENDEEQIPISMLRRIGQYLPKGRRLLELDVEEILNATRVGSSLCEKGVVDLCGGSQRNAVERIRMRRN